MAVQAPARGSAAGLGIAAACFIGWGLMPFYFKALVHVDPVEVVAHRIVWSALFLACLLPFGGRMEELRRLPSSPRPLLTLAFTACLISVNWVIYVVAVQTGNVLDTSLGYFLGPLVSVALGVAVLKERLSRVQAAAVALAALAVVNLIWQLGVVPKVALVLGISFSIYGLLRKRLPVSPALGLLVECLVVLPMALAAFVWVARTKGLTFLHGDAGTDILLVAGVVITAGPLLLFNVGAKRLNYATIGVMQYIAASMLFLESVLIFGEPLAFWRLVTFLLIWTALAMYSADALIRARETRHG